MKVPAALMSSGRDVLIVEDEPRLREMLSRAVREMGFNGMLAPSAEAALKAIEQRPFDIMILDLNLPGMGGMELLEHLRRAQNRGNAPPGSPGAREIAGIQVIILTGFGDLQAARKAIHLDVVEFLTKPCALGALEVALDRARKRRRKDLLPDLSESVEAEEPAARLQFEEEPGGNAPTDGNGTSLEALEQRHILEALEKNQGNRAATANELGISLRKLYYRLSQYQKQGLM